MSSSCVPRSMISWLSNTTICCDCFIVDKRCATTRTVLPTTALFIASCTKCSDSASSADVASSRRRIRGFITRALAIATRCFCPPLSFMPRSPTKVLYP
mmetsp:Transcript_1083/g.993  ORF Transcript_1083/g.993 Transcript_1083/m.993 type:complete len:99 (+) Transcript_1083:332-628(+)